MLPRLCFILLALCAPLGYSQQLSNEATSTRSRDLSRPPASHILDSSQSIPLDDPDFLALSQRLKKISKASGFQLYYVMFDGAVGDELQKKSFQYRDDWLANEKEGIVFACDASSRVIAPLFTKKIKAEYKSSPKAWILPDHLLVQTSFKVLNVKSEESTKEYLLTIGHALADVYENALRPYPEPKVSYTSYILIFTTVVIFCSLLIWRVIAKEKKKVLQDQRMTFPKIVIPPRLGAFYSGGVATEINFVPYYDDSDLVTKFAENENSEDEE